MDRMRALEIFVEVVKRESFARAAEALHTSPANVTRYIGDFEAHLGTRLINRSSRKMSLTHSGEALYARARAILEDVAEAEALASSASLTAHGLLRITAPVSFGILHLAPLWPAFRQRYPEVQLDIALMDRAADVVEEGFDLAIRLTHGEAAALATRKLASSRSILCASPAYLQRHGQPAQLADLAGHEAIGTTLAGTGDDWPLTGPDRQTHVLSLPCGFHTSNADTARAAALAGAGIAGLHGFLVGDDLRAGRLVEVLPAYRMPDVDILAVYPSRRQLSAKVRVMVDFLTAFLAAAPGWHHDADPGDEPV